MGIGDSGTLHHTCFVVHDLDKAAKKLSHDLSIGPWHVWTIEPEDCTVHGRAVPFSFRVALAEVGSSSYELIEPGVGESVYVEHLRTVGEGFHHTCIAYESRATMQAAKAELAAQGRPMVQSGSLGDAGEFCYFRIEETGALLELLYLSGLPEPEMTIT